jgi:myotubularin-related protein 5/13
VVKVILGEFLLSTSVIVRFMTERLVEYLVVVGPGEPTSLTEHIPASQSRVDFVFNVEVTPYVVQRFPTEDRPKCVLPFGVERFCRSQSWYLTSHPTPPYYNNFILTNELGDRLYCSALNFYQPSNKMANRINKNKELLMENNNNLSSRRSLSRSKANGSFNNTRRKAFKKKEDDPNDPLQSSSAISLSSISISIDEDHEANTEFAEELYEPHSICIISKFPLYDALQALLKSLYIYHLLSDQADSPSLSSVLSFESLIAELLVDLRFPIGDKPPLKRGFGPLKELTLSPLKFMQTIPYTSDNTYKLLKAVGVHGLIQIFSLLISDSKIVFISSSTTAITSAIVAITALMFPIGIEQFACVLIPSGFLEFLHCITPFIMGLHRSLLVELDEEPLDVTLVDLDSGEVKLGETVESVTIPSELYTPLKTALTKINDSFWEHRDNVFAPSVRPKSIYYQDKAVRAVFMNVFLYLMGNYQRHITVIRFHPEPKFHFHSEDYFQQYCVGDDSDTWRNFLKIFTGSIGFVSFTHGNRILPYRLCDFFDELVKDYCSQPVPVSIASLFSQSTINELAERLHKIVPPAIQHGGVFTQFSNSLISENALIQRFPKFKEEEFKVHYDDLELRWKGADSTSPSDIFSNVPLAEFESTNGFTSLTRNTTSTQKDMEALTKFLDALFSSRILEARKYLGTVNMSLRQRTITDVFVPELVNKLLRNGPYLTPDQFEVLVMVVNCAIVDEKVAMSILPLASVFYQEIQPGINQYLYTCIQSHSLWSSIQFWCRSLYNAIQSELVRLYADTKLSKGLGFSRRSTASIDEEYEYEEQYDEMMDNDMMTAGEVTLRHRQRIRSVSPTRVRTTARSVALSKNARMRIRACSTIPGASEGVLPPDSKPVTSFEALHHLAKRLKVWPSFDGTEMDEVALQEENAIRNQVTLFISRLINIRTPIDKSGDKDKKTFVAELTRFVDEFLSCVDTELDLNHIRQTMIMEQVEPLIEVHLNSIESLRRALKKSPTAKMRMAPLPLLSGESIIIEGTHCFLLSDGRDTGYWVPADGHIYITSYRVVFLGSPWDPDVDPNILVTRSMPVSSIYRIKELSHIPSGLSEGFFTLFGLQIRSATSELMRLGFDEDSGGIANMKKFSSRLHDMRYPLAISVGIKNQSQFELSLPDRALSQGASNTQQSKGKKSSTDQIIDRLSQIPSQMKLISDLSQSPYCQEYDRLGLGSINFMSKNKGQWRLSAVNTSYNVCSSYPSVLVVPDKVSDESLARIAQHFNSNRLPVVTWKHHKTKALLLRSSSFIVPATSRKKNLLSSKLLSDKSSEADSVGILSADIEGFVNTVVSACPKVKEDGEDDPVYWSGSFSRDVTMPPPSLRFDLTEERSSGLASQITSSGQKYVTPVVNEPRYDPASHYKHSLYASSEDPQMLDWEMNEVTPTPTYQRETSEDLSALPSSLNFSRQSSTGPPMSLMPLSSIHPMSLYHEISEEDLISEESSHQMTPSPEVNMTDVGREDLISEGSLVLDWSPKEPGGVIGRGLNKLKKKNTQVTFASIPTNPRDWVVMDALQEEIKQWKLLGLYIIGEKSVLTNVATDIYNNCTLLPVEIPHHNDIGNSFSKLMKACAPSGSFSGKFYSLIEDSEWVNQLSSLLQLSGAIAELMEAQGSSVMICLEDGWDVTSQVVSLAQVLMDPYYRTLEGFQALIEKDWLGFGHPFTKRGSHLQDRANEQLSPVFLQFLDCVHQLQRQFPLSFEFNDFFLRIIAYHSFSMRFHTFTMNSEKERCALNWLPYRPRPAYAYGSSSSPEPFASFWEFIEQLHENSMMFYNFLYQHKEEEMPDMLRPLSYQANLDVWSFYTEDLVSQFPPYDVELISEDKLTYSDLHHDVFAWDSALADLRVPIDPPSDVANELTYLMKRYTGLMNELGQKADISLVGWRRLWIQLLNEFDETVSETVAKSIKNQLPSVEAVNPEMTLDRATKLQCQTLHKTTSLAVLVKGKISMEIEQKYQQPHNFVSFKIETGAEYECCYCHHIIRDKEGFKCKGCYGACHVYCKHQMPSNCGTVETQQVTTSITQQQAMEEMKRPRSRTNTNKKNKKGLHELEGFLYKKGGVVKNWKERYFVLDLEKKHLAYFESDSKGSKLCGKISLNVILEVEECDPVHGKSCDRHMII